ncbi:hypothetical protein B0H14DRAFT_2782550, partial [Mycena olivaceomarginata]
MAISIGNLNGAVSSNVVRASPLTRYYVQTRLKSVAPRKRPTLVPPGHGLVLAYICIGIIANATFLYFLKKENARRD